MLLFLLFSSVVLLLLLSTKYRRSRFRCRFIQPKQLSSYVSALKIYTCCSTADKCVRICRNLILFVCYLFVICSINSNKFWYYWHLAAVMITKLWRSLRHLATTLITTNRKFVSNHLPITLQTNTNHFKIASQFEFIFLFSFDNSW